MALEGTGGRWRVVPRNHAFTASDVEAYDRKAQVRLLKQRLLTIPQVAQELNASENHVYRLIASGDLRAVDISQRGALRSKTRVRSDDLADYIERQTRQRA